MVKQLEHSSLNLSIARLIIIESLGADCVNFIDEDNSRLFLLGKSKGVSDHLGAVTDIHLNQT